MQPPIDNNCHGQEACTPHVARVELNLKENQLSSFVAIASKMSDSNGESHSNFPPEALLFRIPAEVLLKGAMKYTIERNVKVCVNARRERINNWDRQPLKKRAKFNELVQSMSDIEVPDRCNGFYLISCKRLLSDGSSESLRKNGFAGVAAEWSTVEKIMMRYGVGGYHLEEGKPRPYPLDIDNNKRKSYGVHIATLEPWPFDDDGNICPNAVVSLAKRLSTIFSFGDEVFATCAYMHRHLSLFDG